MSDAALSAGTVRRRPVTARVRRVVWAEHAAEALLLGCALSVFGIAALLFGVLLVASGPALHRFGVAFFTGGGWNPVAHTFGALPFMYGTAVSSSIALLIAVPVSLGTAVFLAEICPGPLRGPVSFLMELLAAIPGVVYGLWALFVLVPLLRTAIGPFLIRWFGATGMFAGPNYGLGLLSAGIILAIMIVPVIASVSRDILDSVPRDAKEAVLALGATRWEAIRLGVLPPARSGIAGAILLGLGRALGETMAVTMVIGNHAAISRNLLAPSYTLSSVLANEFVEAVSRIHLGALLELGFVLLLISTVVNVLARLLVWAVTSRARSAWLRRVR